MTIDLDARKGPFFAREIAALSIQIADVAGPCRGLVKELRRGVKNYGTNTGSIDSDPLALEGTGRQPGRTLSCLQATRTQRIPGAGLGLPVQCVTCLFLATTCRDE